MVNESYPPEFNLIFFPSKHQDAKMSVYTVRTAWVGGFTRQYFLLNIKASSGKEKRCMAHEISFFSQRVVNFLKLKAIFFLHMHKNSKEMDKIYSRVVRASDCQCQSRHSPGFAISILRHSGNLRAADYRMLNNVHTKRPVKNFNKCQNYHENILHNMKI